jgi:hypothetical protein
VPSAAIRSSTSRDHAAHELDRVGRLDLDRGLAEGRPVQAGLAVNVGRGAELPVQRLLAAGRDRHGGDPGDRAHTPGVQCGLGQRLVARHGGDAEQVDRQAGRGQQDGHSVVVTRVAVEQDRNGHRSLPGQAVQPADGIGHLGLAGEDREDPRAGRGVRPGQPLAVGAGEREVPGHAVIQAGPP